MEGIYDEPEVTVNGGFGFIDVDNDSNSGTLYIDATSYTRWTYIDFHAKSIDTLEINGETSEPLNWDIAVHRYDAKTNGGSVLETGFTGFDALKASGKMPVGTFVEDVWTTEQIAVDMSGMMDGVIKYVDSDYNAELSKWLNVDTSTMPPIYTLSKKVYLVRLDDGTYLALRLSNFMNDASVKGYMTIDYIYPFDV